MTYYKGAWIVPADLVHDVMLNSWTLHFQAQNSQNAHGDNASGAHGTVWNDEIQTEFAKNGWYKNFDEAFKIAYTNANIAIKSRGEYYYDQGLWNNSRTAVFYCQFVSNGGFVREGWIAFVLSSEKSDVCNEYGSKIRVYSSIGAQILTDQPEPQSRDKKVKFSW